MTDSHKLPTLNLPQNTTLSPTQNTDEVSVMRHTFLGSSFCKAKAKVLTNPSRSSRSHLKRCEADNPIRRHARWGGPSRITWLARPAIACTRGRMATRNG